MGKQLQFFLPETVCNRFFDAIASLEQQQLSEARIVHSLWQASTEHFYEVRLLPLLENQVVAIIRDITNRKQAESQLKQTNEELLRATRLKDEFLANMSHELRTPLNAILGMTEGLQEEVFGSLNERQHKALKTIEGSGSHLLALINDILDVAKIESGQIVLDLSPAAIVPLCKSSFAFVKQQALHKKIQLETKLPNYLPDVLVDERRLRQVLINLLNNAVKFTPEGGKITLEVSHLLIPIDTSEHTNALSNTRTKAAQAAYLRISVTDTGIGISPDDITKLFRPFIQIDSALNRQYQGTGLGLALVKRIVELHNGQVGLSSQVGKGSCFTIDLPCQALPQGLSPSVASLFEATSETDFKPAQAPVILLAEDNEANISTFSSYLKAKGYDVLLAKDGQEAITLTTAQLPDLILMDVQMPRVDGLTAIQQIRLNPALAHIPIVALTALAMDGDRDRCIAAGASDYLSKPVKLKTLLSNIQFWLTKQTKLSGI